MICRKPASNVTYPIHFQTYLPKLFHFRQPNNTKMPSRLTFGVEFEFALALLEAGQDDPEPQLSQPPTTLPTSSNPIYHKWSNAVTNSVFDLVTTKMAAAGLPTRSLKRDVSPNSSPGSSSGGSRDDAQDVVIDDGVGWITPRRRRPRLRPGCVHQALRIPMIGMMI